jgi:prolyl-tRNA synthetase
VSYLQHLETEDVKVQHLDFQNLAMAPTPAAAPTKGKEDAKVEGTVQIAIGVKKEADFAAWYTNVSVSNGLDSMPC